MPKLKLVLSHASSAVRCSLCMNSLGAGELFWRFADVSDIFICSDHIPLNVTGFENTAPTEGCPYTVVECQHRDVRRDIIPPILENWDAIFSLTDEDFEELVYDRLLAMGLQAFRTGRANKKDGGIDIVFWTRDAVPVLGAVQVKHHRSASKTTGPAAVRELAACMNGQNFNVGMVVTNTRFTTDAIWWAQEYAKLIQLRDNQILRNWIADDFIEGGWRTRPRTIELCPGVQIVVPQFK